MKKQTKILFATAFGLLAVLGASVYASGGSLQGRFTTAGSELTIEVASTTPRADILISPSDHATAGLNAASAYSFTTSGEALLVEKLAVSLKGTTPYNPITIEYEDSDGVTRADLAYVVEGIASFTGLDFYIPEADSKTLTIYADVLNIGTGATSGDVVKAVIAKSNFKAVGQDTGTTFTTLTFAATTEPNNMTIYQTKPTFSLDSSSPSGTRSVSAVDSMFVFNIHADDGGEVTVKDLRINLTSSADFNTAAVVTATLEDPDTGTVFAGPLQVRFSNASTAYIPFSDDFTVSASDDQLLELVLDSATLLDEDSGVDDPVTAKINLGSSPVSGGGVVWNDGYNDVRWMGALTSSTLTGNTVNY